MFNDCCYRFECGYINKPYCSLRPISCITPCPRFSCPPPFHFTSDNCGCGCGNNSFCDYNFNNLPYWNNNLGCNCNNGCNNFHQNFPYCCPPWNNINNPCCKPRCNFCMNPNLLWFLGGINCGKNLSNVSRTDEF